MNIYVIQIYTQSEEKYIELAEKALKAEGLYEEEKGKIFWPRRTLIRKKGGVTTRKTDALYPGYVFYRSPGLETEMYKLFKGTAGFVRFLKDNHNIEPLSPEDEEIVLHFLSFGEIADTSKAYFDENNMIRIVDGPLKGMEGRIIKVDKRKKRAKVVLNLYKNNYPIDFGFELIAPAEKDNEAEKKQ